MRKSNKIIALVLSIILTVSMSATVFAATKAKPNEWDSFGTSAEGPKYPQIRGEYRTVDSLVGIKKKQKEFILEVKVDGKTEKLHLTFPSTGGFRLTGSHKGYFAPKDVQDITYQKNDKTMIQMRAEDGTAVSFKKEGSGFRLSVFNKENRKLFDISPEQIAFSFENSEIKKVRLELPLASEESIYGTGERFNELDQTGKRLLMWNVDAGYNNATGALNAEKWRGYKNVPIIYSNRGYTLFFNSFYSGRLDIGYTNSKKCTMEFQGPDFDFFVWTGTPKENISGYTSLTGASIVLPKWGYRYMAGGHSTFWETYGGSTIGSILKMQQGFKNIGIPDIAAVYVESADITDAKIYNALKKTGTKLLTWNSPDYNIDTMKGYLPGVDTKKLPITKSVNNPLADVGCFIDFTDPMSKTMLNNRIGNYGKLGWAGGLVDFGELIPLRALFRGNGSTGAEMHNMFPYWETKVYNEVLKEKTIDGGVTFSRAGCAGAQSYSAFFNGDQASGMNGMKMQLISGLSDSVSGFTMWGADLGGLDGSLSNEVYARAVEFSAFQPIMRAHGQTSRFPWDYGKTGEKTYLKYYWLRENLLNTIYSTAIKSNKKGTPVATPLTMEYPNEAKYDGLYTTYLFCDDFLVSPVLEEQAYLNDVAFPKGTWYGLYNGDKIEGGKTKQVEAPIDEIPVYLKAGATVPVTVSDSLNLSDSMQDVDKAEALLVTIPDEERENIFYKDENTCVKYVSTRVDENTFEVKAGSGNETTAVILKGSAAYSVELDGEKLECLDNKPNSKGEKGYFCENNEQTIINLGKKDWKKIKISLGKIQTQNVLKDAKVSDKKLAATIDGDYNSKYVLSNKAGTEDLIYELKEKNEIQNIKVKWTAQYSEKYKVSVSENGKEWKEVLSEEEGIGGIKEIPLKGTIAKYIKIHDVEKKTGSVPTLYEVEAYGVQATTSIWIYAIIIVLICIVIALMIVTLKVLRRKKHEDIVSRR